MKKKVTLRKIAEEAGVSVATVSYVLNNRDDQCISEETRKKVLQIVNLYGYQINFSAKSISSGRTNNIALYLGHGSFALKRAEYMLLIRRLTKHLKDKNLTLRVVDNNETSRLDYCDAVICCDQEESFFKTVSNVNFCPLIAFDMFYDDSLFCQVNSNYQKINSIAQEIFNSTEFTVVSFDHRNVGLKKELCSTFQNIVFVDKFEDINALQCKNIVALGEMLGQYCKTINKNTLSFDLCSHEKIDMLITCIEKTIKRDYVEHDIRV